MKAIKEFSLFFVLFLFVSPILSVLTTSPVYAENSERNQKLKELISVAGEHNEKNQNKNDDKENILIQSNKKTRDRIVTFKKELTNQEVADFETRYDVRLEEARNNRFLITPNHNHSLDILENDSSIKEVINNDTYQISAQIIDWGINKMNIQAAWNFSTPDSGDNVVVALLDTGVQLNHPDLSTALLSGGHDYVNNDEDPSDDQGHGTSMAGVIVAQNNAEGIVGTAYGAKILPLKVCGADGQCAAIAIADAIDDAVAAHVDIINMSFGGISNAFIHDAIQSAVDAGIIVVAAAGNSGVEGCLYPAAYDGVVCVGSTTDTDERASFSNFGSSLDVMTPGLFVNTTALLGTYSVVSGTSISTAYYSGAAALIVARLKIFCAVEPTNVACADKGSFTQSLLNEVTVRDLGLTGKDSQFGNGIVDISQFFTSTTTVHTIPTAQLRAGIVYSQPITFSNGNAFAISLTSCSVKTKNNSRVQTVPVFVTNQLLNGVIPYTNPTSDSVTTTFTFPSPIAVNTGGVENFNYQFTPSVETLSNDAITYSFVCSYDKIGTAEVESYRAQETKLTAILLPPLIPATLQDVYFTFGKLRYNQTVYASQLRAYDTVYLKNYDPKKVKLTQFFLYDYAKKGNQGFTRTWKTSTSFTLRTNYLLPGGKRYAYIAEFQDIATGTKIKKYFVFRTK